MSTHVITWPAPESEPASPDFQLSINETPVFVYSARVRAEIRQHPGLWTHAPDPAGERAAFALADFDGPVEVAVRVTRPFATAMVLPLRTGIIPTIEGDTVRFTLDRPRHLTLALDGSDQQPLHLFFSEPETDIPAPDDPNVLYFGPGVYEVVEIAPRSGQTVYLAGGALVRAVLQPGEEGRYSEKWHVTFYGGSVIRLHDVDGVTVRGRGILDASAIPHPGRSMLHFKEASNVVIAGITLRDAANWNFVIGSSRGVTVDNVRIISGRLNSDGINSVNSSNVHIHDCFVRNHDDSAAVKTTAPAPPAEHILVENCAIWNDWGYALGPTYETRAPISDVTYRHCDIHFARHWCMGVHVSDSATVRGITFRDIEISPLRAPAQGAYAALAGEPVLLKLAVVEDVWGNDPERGRIRDVSVEGVTVHGDRMLCSQITGLDDEHNIAGVNFLGVRLAGHPLAADAASLRLERIEHAEDVRIKQ